MLSLTPLPLTHFKLVSQQMNSLMSTLPNPYSQKVLDFNVPKVTNEG